MNLRFGIAGTLLALLIGCGGGSSNSTFSGAIRGRQLRPADAISGSGSYRISSTQSINVAVVVLSSASGLCGNASAGRQPKNSQFFVITLSDRTGPQTAIPTAPGTYTVNSTTKFAGVGYLETDATCQTPMALQATANSGTVVLTSVTNGLSGSFDVTLDTGDHVTGSFNAPNCGGLLGFLNLASPTCI